ncbi:MAG: shikimate kinase [Thermodesulfobacteriota bacterium]|nr:shikimate kinase [Thermodesulfobacteriota bacterium]
MNIVLIGYRGTGKSEVGAMLSQRLSMPCIGMDAEIVRRAGCSIPEIVEKQGWPGFRDAESALVLELAGRDNLIIDTGGGVIERPGNMAALQKNGEVFWLTASVDTIVSRIHTDTQRPSLTGGKSFTDEVAEVLARRIPLYRASAHHEIVTDGLSPARVADTIVSLLQKRSGRPA